MSRNAPSDCSIRVFCGSFRLNSLVAKDNITVVRSKKKSPIKKKTVLNKQGSRKAPLSKNQKPIVIAEAPSLSGKAVEVVHLKERMESALSEDALFVDSYLRNYATNELKSLFKTIIAHRKESLPEINPDEELAVDWLKGGYPYKHRLSRKSYEKGKYGLQVELLKLQAWVKETRQRVVILFEGRDAAGKGGTIKRFMEHLNPRGARVVALEKPSIEEQGQWYFQRYVEHLPTYGEIVLFDRSWYNRAGVERVMGFCTDDEYLAFMKQAPEFERMLVKSGIHLFKFWFSVSRAEQKLRFKDRQNHPLKQWKLSPIDKASLDKWEDYTRAKEAMFFHTDTAEAP